MVTRDLIFLSYAIEDIPFSDWLALKLTSAGYKVWYDRMSLLAGKSFIKEVDDAIGKRAYRVLALLSKSSIGKENPVNEWTKAIAVGKSIGIDDFLVTLNLDGLIASQIPWTLSQKSYVNSSWADGLNLLLKTLVAANAPRDEAAGAALVHQWFSAKDQPAARQERVWTNVIPVVSLPPLIRRYENIGGKDLRSLEQDWLFATENRDFVWAFEEPPDSLKSDFNLSNTASWIDSPGDASRRLNDKVKFLLSRSLENYCLKRGLVQKKARDLIYFPKGLLPDDKISFIGLRGKKTYFKVIGERKFRGGGTNIEINRHHLAPGLKLIRGDDGNYHVQLINRLYITDKDGNPIHPTRMARRRKKICKNWWNDKWGSRLLGVISWFSENRDSIEIFKTPEGSFTLSGKALSLSAQFGINEDAEDPADLLSDDSEGLTEPPIDDSESLDVLKDFSGEKMEDES
jgi:hypothetical protein